MANLLTYQYFLSGRASIKGLTGVDTGGVVTAKRLELASYIAVVEKKILKRLLGDDLYAAFIVGLAMTPIATRWTALKAQIVDTTSLTSPLTAFVWHMWLTDHQVQNMANGQVKLSASDAAPMANAQMICDVYNTAVNELSDIYEWIGSNAATYTEWKQEAFDFGYINPFDI
jgi:hypothetical protein